MSDEYYDISIRACGFLNRVQTVEREGSPGYLACNFAALRGAKGERAEPTYFDAMVVGSHAKALLTNYKSVVNDRSRKVFVSVRLSDLYVRSFVWQKGERKGETGYAIKTRLLVIESLAIDGVVAYRRSEDPTVGRRSDRDRPDATAAASSASVRSPSRARGNARA